MIDFSEEFFCKNSAYLFVLSDQQTTLRPLLEPFPQDDGAGGALGHAVGGQAGDEAGKAGIGRWYPRAE